MKDGKPWIVDCECDPSIDLKPGKIVTIPSHVAFANGQEVPNRVLLEKDYNPGTAQPGDFILKSPSKDTNPKDPIGATKLSMSLVPTSGIQAASLAFLEGALKYGRYNWRVSGVRTSIYMDAIWRHLDKYWNGEYADPVTKVPHLSSVLACVMIIIDADRMGKLTDDRPPAMPFNSLRIDDTVDMVAHLKELFKDHHPHQYMITDTDGDGPVAFNSEDTCPST